MKLLSQEERREIRKMIREKYQAQIDEILAEQLAVTKLEEAVFWIDDHHRRN